MSNAKLRCTGHSRFRAIEFYRLTPATRSQSRAVALFRQAYLPAKSLQPGIATKKRKFRKRKSPADAKWSEHCHAVEGFQRALLITQARKGQSVLEGIPRDRSSIFFRFLPPSSPA